jgi:hypothetical protein
MKTRAFIAFAVASLLSATLAFGVKVDGPGEAEAKSTHILNGTVSGVYSRIARDATHEVTYSIAEVKVDSVEKGEGFAPGQVIYVRYIASMRWISKDPMPPGPGPHSNIPKQGESRRIFLAKNTDGTLDVFYVGGFKNVEPKKP